MDVLPPICRCCFGYFVVGGAWRCGCASNQEARQWNPSQQLELNMLRCHLNGVSAPWAGLRRACSVGCKCSSGTQGGTCTDQLKTLDRNRRARLCTTFEQEEQPLSKATGRQQQNHKCRFHCDTVSDEYVSVSAEKTSPRAGCKRNKPVALPPLLQCQISVFIVNRDMTLCDSVPFCPHEKPDGSRLGRFPYEDPNKELYGGSICSVWRRSHKTSHVTVWFTVQTSPKRPRRLIGNWHLLRGGPWKQLTSI